jgi:hypothetical protein
VRAANLPAERVAHDVGPLEAEVVEQPGDVVGHELGTQRPVDVGGPAVTLQVDGDDAPAAASSGSIGANIAPAPIPPCSRISGSPEPCSS